MSTRILVAYASKEGSTAEIAHAVARELENREITVVVAEMNSVTTLETYDALVLGTPIYAGKFLADVPAFITKHRECIIHIPVAGFVTGIAPVYPKAGDPKVIAGALGEAMAPAKPVAITMFAGKFDPGNQGFLVASWILHPSREKTPSKVVVPGFVVLKRHLWRTHQSPFISRTSLYPAARVPRHEEAA